MFSSPLVILAMVLQTTSNFWHSRSWEEGMHRKRGFWRPNKCLDYLHEVVNNPKTHCHSLGEISLSKISSSPPTGRLRVFILQKHEGREVKVTFPSWENPGLMSLWPSAKQAAEFSIVTAIIKSVETTRLVITDSLHASTSATFNRLECWMLNCRNTFCSWEILCGCAPLWHYSDQNPYLCSHAGNKVVSTFCTPGDNVSALQEQGNCMPVHSYSMITFDIKQQGKA